MRKTIRHVLNRVTRIASHTEENAVISDTCKLVRDATASLWTFIILLDHEQHLFRFADSCGIPPQEAARLKKLDLPQASFPLSHRLARSSRPLTLKGPDLAPLLSDETISLTSGATITAFPLLVKPQLLGALFIARPQESPPFTKAETALLQHLVSHAALTLSHITVRNQLLDVAIEAARQYEEMHEIFIGTISSLANAIDAKSAWTKGHSERVMHLSLRIAREMGMDIEETEQLRIAALLHDVGKIGIIEALLEKPERLKDDEFPPMRLHPEKGVAILAPIQRLKKVLPGILHHHERYDGKGYPTGLAGEDIPLHARIIAVADAYDAMVSSRPYRKGTPNSNALDELDRCAGTQFDPHVVHLFTGLMRKRRPGGMRKQS